MALLPRLTASSLEGKTLIAHRPSIDASQYRHEKMFSQHYLRRRDFKISSTYTSLSNELKIPYVASQVSVQGLATNKPHEEQPQRGFLSREAAVVANLITKSLRILPKTWKREDFGRQVLTCKLECSALKQHQGISSWS